MPRSLFTDDMGRDDLGWKDKFKSGYDPNPDPAPKTNPFNTKSGKSILGDFFGGSLFSADDLSGLNVLGPNWTNTNTTDDKKDTNTTDDKSDTNTTDAKTGIGGKSLSVFGKGGLFEGYSVPDKYKPFFEDYDDTKENYVREGTAFKQKGLTNSAQMGLMGLGNQQGMMSAKSDFSGSGAGARAMDIGRNQLMGNYGIQSGLLGLSRDEDIFGLQESFRERSFDRMADLMKSGADIQGPGGQDNFQEGEKDEKTGMIWDGTEWVHPDDYRANSDPAGVRS